MDWKVDSGRIVYTILDRKDLVCKLEVNTADIYLVPQIHQRIRIYLEMSR